MGTILAMSKAWASVNLAKEAMFVIAETQNEIADLQREQLMSGETKTSQKIKPKYRNPYYAKKKADRNPLAGYGTPDLKNTGEFHAGIFVKLVGDEAYEITSKDSKTSDLVAKYGPEIFGMNNESKTEYNTKTMQPMLVGRIKAKTGAK